MKKSAFLNRISVVANKVIHWEYWPVWMIYFPCFLIYPYYAFRLKSFFFFTAANPSIKNGGAFLTSKESIYNILPQVFIPQTKVINKDYSVSECLDWMTEQNVAFPIILKPDLGIRGKGVFLIHTREKLEDVLGTIEEDYLLQEFVKYKQEIGVFLVRKKNNKFDITSIVEKEFIAIEGDGKSSIEELVLAVPRFAMQFDYLKDQNGVDFQRVPTKGEYISFDPIGNHARGTMFKDGSHLKSDELTEVFNSIFAPVEGFNYGRIDVKFDDINDVISNHSLKIIELNGVFSEPGHIYDLNYTLVKAWKDLLIHFNYLYVVSGRAISQGYQPLNLIPGKNKLIAHLRAN